MPKRHAVCGQVLPLAYSNAHNSCFQPLRMQAAKFHSTKRKKKTRAQKPTNPVTLESSHPSPHDTLYKTGLLVSSLLFLFQAEAATLPCLSQYLLCAVWRIVVQGDFVVFFSSQLPGYLCQDPFPFKAVALTHIPPKGFLQ